MPNIVDPKMLFKIRFSHFDTLVADNACIADQNIYFLLGSNFVGKHLDTVEIPQINIDVAGQLATSFSINLLCGSACINDISNNDFASLIRQAVNNSLTDS